MGKLFAECTWGDGPSIIVGNDNTTFDLTITEAEKLIQDLSAAILQAKELEQTCSQHDSMEAKEGINIVQHDNHLGISYRTIGERPALSVCELTRSFPDIYSDLITFPENAIVYEFNRIKVGFGREGKGDGTKMMEKLVEIADDQKFFIVGGINAYGRMNREDLIKWYGKYGFEMLEEGLMVRKPV